jgi:hypothetical protein
VQANHFTGVPVSANLIFGLLVWMTFWVWWASKPAKNLFNGLKTGVIRSKPDAVARTVYRRNDPSLFRRSVVYQSLSLAWRIGLALLPLGGIAW